MSDFDVLFPIPSGGRNADDMGMPPSLADRAAAYQAARWRDAQSSVPTPARNFPRCTKTLQAQGVAYPRTCYECGLGPCRA